MRIKTFFYPYKKSNVQGQVLVDANNTYNIISNIIPD